MKHKYMKQVYLGYSDTGKQVKKRVYADTMDELKLKIRQLQNEHDLTPNTSEITFGEYSRLWLSVSKGTKSKQTQDVAKTSLRKCAALDRLPIRRITRSQLQAVVNESWEHPHAAKGVADVFRQIFTMAQNDGIIARNPALKLDRPKILRAEHHLLTERELEGIRKADLNEQDRMFVTILQTFGLRPAEALALQPMDFDIPRKILHITKALEMTNDNKSTLKSTKTGEKRDIPIPDCIIPTLKAYFRRNKGFLLFTNKNGQMHTKSSYKRMQQRVWTKVNEALGGDPDHSLVAGRSFYDFRHWRATQWYYLCQKGIVSPKQCAALLGHSEIIFLSTYSHLDPDREKLTEIYPDMQAAEL